MLPMLNENYKHYILNVLVFFFPILTATVKSAGGVIFFLLVLAGCVKGKAAWKGIELWEKMVLFGFIIFFVLISLTLFGTQNMATGISKLERYLYFVAFVPAYLLIRRYGVETGKSLLLGSAMGSFVMLFQALYQSVTITGWLPQDWLLQDWLVKGAYHKIIFGDASMMAAIIVGAGLAAIALRPAQYVVGILAVFSGIAASILSGARTAWVFLPISIITIFV